MKGTLTAFWGLSQKKKKKQDGGPRLSPQRRHPVNNEVRKQSGLKRSANDNGLNVEKKNKMARVEVSSPVRRVVIDDDDDDDDVIVRKPRSRLKRARIVDDDDDDDDYQPQMQSEEDDAEEEEEVKAVKVQKNSSNNADLSTYQFGVGGQRVEAASRKQRVRASKMSFGGGAESDNQTTNGQHVVQDFLKPEFIMDANRRRPDHPEYNGRTVYIPPHVFKKLSPGQRQYWEIKRENFDVILFYKVGKFYEIFDNDADIGHKELGLVYMKGERRHVGFPEAAFQKYATRLVQKGFKVARVEQTQTPDAMRKANAKKAQGTTKQKVVNREVVSVLSPGTLVEPGGNREHAGYLLAMTEEPQHKFGVCYVDAATGTFTFGEFKDDAQLTSLRTLLALIRPMEVVYPKGGLSLDTTRMLLGELSTDVIRNEVSPETEFWSGDTTVSQLSRDVYFSADRSAWPDEVLAQQHNMLAMSALGGCIWYLKRVLLDEELVSMRKFLAYDPTHVSTNAKYMALDGQTLENLEILENQDRKSEGTLLRHIDHCVTPFGKRCLKQWVARPLAMVSDIEHRLCIVDELVNNEDLRSSLMNDMRKLPDLERLVSRIHAQGLGRDRNAIMYHNVNKKRMEQFIRLLDGLKAAAQISQSFTQRCTDLKSGLVDLLAYGRGFPALYDTVEEFQQSFDRREAQKSGVVRPMHGVDPVFDNAESQQQSIEAELQECLREAQRTLRCSKAKFVHRNKERYQIEVPHSLAVPANFSLMSQTKSVKRYWTKQISGLVTELEGVEEKRDECLRNAMRNLFRRFSERNADWIQAIDCMARVDALCSLAHTSALQERTCRPVFVNSDTPVLELRECIHPALATLSTTSFIPNDTVVGTAENQSRFVLVSGPNMGGKSTLLRQTCIAVIMAHIGCYVPATECRLTSVDQIFTRVGANDRIMQGQSTFLVELEETANILRHATSRSLVILDELGRGTSTFDGTAIAYSVIQYLSQHTGCLTLFSTHYHMLMEEFANDERISMYHMDCQVHDGDDRVTFLYKFVKGTCPKSYGMNVARLAGLDSKVINRARQMSEHFERRLELAHQSGMGLQNSQQLVVSLRLDQLREVERILRTGTSEQIETLRQDIQRKFRCGDLRL